eukprot:CAMPEP_0168703470 /NCGR_PEP_ID=MMETSP0503-20121227/39075_1 /TAXON_ID=89963 /ORGANISM="Heterocapsa rotundata, Strain SCCAP K-0483" /LENGTH=83 /DNA_ID=CAMNT_0008749645 /DNA_START=15 /DNA_END=262 /DNA_ORIENTATION=+
MVLDLSVQLSLTTGVYLSGTLLGTGAMYQISSLQTAFPQYGIGYVFGMSIMFKIRGAQLIAAREHEAFYRFLKQLLVVVTCLA